MTSLTFAIDSVSAAASTGVGDLAGVVDSPSIIRSVGFVGLIAVGEGVGEVDLGVVDSVGVYSTDGAFDLVPGDEGLCSYLGESVEGETTRTTSPSGSGSFPFEQREDKPRMPDRFIFCLVLPD